jgi:phage terminase small subunit
MRRGLSERQERFVDAYLTRGPGFLCATRAARLAGYAWPDKQGPRLLSFPHVSEAVETRFRGMLREIKERPPLPPRGRRGDRDCM